MEEHTPDVMRVAELAEFLRTHRTVVLTGAGVSTESGIPDYRGPETRRRARNPIRFQQFTSNPEWRKRYWARSLIGWPRMLTAQPNPGHRALANLESLGLVRGIITQNVDRLHHAAGSRNVVELHGALAEVICLECEEMEPRSQLQERMLRLNPGFQIKHDVETAPDGDAELDPQQLDGFEAPVCLHCGGVIKPNVVFFGENVPSAVKNAAFSMFDEAESLLIIGSSLAVYSGYRFIRRATQQDKPVAVINLGPMERGEEAVDLRIDARSGDILPKVLQRHRALD